MYILIYLHSETHWPFTPTHYHTSPVCGLQQKALNDIKYVQSNAQVSQDQINGSPH